VPNILETFPVVQRIVAQANAAVQQAGGKAIVFRRSFDFVTQDFPYGKNDKGEIVSLIGGGEVVPSAILAADNSVLTAKDVDKEKLPPGPYRFCATINILDKEGKTTNALLTEPIAEKPGLLSLSATPAVTPDLAFTVPEVRGGDAIPQNYVGRTGAGVIVGIIDYGFDFAHPNFLKADGTSRLIALWDQNGTVNNGVDTVLNDVRPTSGVWYKSTGYTNSYIYTPGGQFNSGANTWPMAPANRLNDLAKNANPYTVYDPHANYFAVPVPFAPTAVPDEYGAHGTHVADICVGNGTATGRPGIAPEADIIFVQLPSPASDGGPADLANVLDAVHFIIKVADLRNQPAVVNMCVNANSGPHNATDYYTSILDKYVLGTSGSGTSKRVPIVVAAGNLFLVARDRVKLDKDPTQAGAWNKAYRETMAQRLTLVANTADTFYWLIRKGDTTPNTLQLYYRVTGADNVAVTASGRLLTPATQNAPGGAAVTITSSNGATPVGSIQMRGTLPANDQPRSITITIDPTAFPAAGIHKLDDFLVKVAVTSTTARTVHAFVERDGLNALPQSTLAIAKADLDTKLNGCTLGTLSCGAETIAVAAYFASDRTGTDAQIAEFSGAGPALDYPTLDAPPGAGPLQPFVAAPGMLVRAARSKGGRPQPEPDHGFAVGMSGTSMAAPHVSGTIALMLAKRNNATPAEIKAALKASARPHPLVYRAWDSRLGHGRLDVKGALDKT